jgi:hypothetical protein
LRFNNDSASNYAWQYVRGTGSTPQAFQTSSDWWMVVGHIPGLTGLASWAGISEIVIPSYAGTTWKKACMSNYLDARGITTTTQVIYAGSGVWDNTAAITRIQVLSVGGGSGGGLTAGSTLRIYGRL